MMVISNFYVTHSLMVAFAVAAALAAVAEAIGRVIRPWRLLVPALLASISALLLVAYPTWGELKNPGLWMFAIIATVVGVARGHWMPLEVDHTWHLIRLRRAYDCLAAAGALTALATTEIVIATTGPGDQPTMELGMTVLASFLVGRAGAALVRSRHEPQVDLHDNPAPSVEG
jgi:hypothetical protein